ncbi:Retrovirus-related Pol polyprotein from transposon TNT 1-94 [Senna tora]|uniref:Retrovirus-related Pol polyprotein from transposon TNT 1-94 n=1 Tax=Senna tora TaxID=362788 RepID=A0A835CD55_9FABA|nr:Retrovirus-related Pol polyprotein from transposon TNT 1-94 [Senna tora]
MHGIYHRISCPHTHEQNGVAKCKHCHITEMGLTLLAHASMPLKYWDEAFRAAVYTINRLPTSVLSNSTPLQTLFNIQPNYHNLKTFGCTCYPYLRPYNTHKFDFKSAKCTFFGYSLQHKGYKCLHPSGRIYLSHHVLFDESTFPFQTTTPQSTIPQGPSTTSIPTPVIPLALSDNPSSNLRLHPPPNPSPPPLPHQNELPKLKFRPLLHSVFALKDLGQLHFFLGIKVNYLRDGSMLLTQTKYLCDLLLKVGMSTLKPVDTPMISSLKLTKEVALLIMVLQCKNQITLISWDSLTSTGGQTCMIVDPEPVGVSTLARTSSPGPPRNSQWSLILAPKQNIEALQILSQRLFGFSLSFKSFMCPLWRFLGSTMTT